MEIYLFGEMLPSGFFALTEPRLLPCSADLLDVWEFCGGGGRTTVLGVVALGVGDIALSFDVLFVVLVAVDGGRRGCFIGGPLIRWGGEDVETCFTGCCW